jgi:hypothetical protein
MKLFKAQFIVILIMSGLGFLAQANAMERGVDLGINFPHIYNLSYETLAKERRYSWSVGGGWLPPISFTLNNTPMEVGMLNFNVRGRWHPFAGGFFIGAGLG